MEDLRDNFTVKELQEMCRKLGLPTFGVKDHIVERIATHFSPTGNLKIDGFCQTNVVPNTPTRFALLETLIRHRHKSMPNLTFKISHTESNPLESVSGEESSNWMQLVEIPAIRAMSLSDSRFMVIT